MPFTSLVLTSDAAQTQRRSPSPHPENGVQGAELAGIRGGAASARQPDLVHRGRGTGQLAHLWTRRPASLQGCRHPISAPDHTTISRRAVTLPVIQPASVPDGCIARDEVVKLAEDTQHGIYRGQPRGACNPGSNPVLTAAHMQQTPPKIQLLASRTDSPVRRSWSRDGRTPPNGRRATIC
jgi:hypothetical protein